MPVVIAVCIGLVMLTGVLFLAFPEAQLSTETQVSMISSLVIVAAILVSIFQRKINISQVAKSVMAWGAIGIVLMVGYAFRHDMGAIKDRLTSSIYPASGTVNDNGEVRFEVAEDGHYYVLAKVNGVDIKFMLDTGASRVVINQRDAKRLGLDQKDLSYTNQSSTANGTVWSAPVTLESVTVADKTLNNIPASVSQSDLNISLLGMSYLDKLKGYRVEKGAITLLY